MRRVFADTSVLFPFSVMDLLLALAERGVHHVLWTDELLAEWERVVVREHRRSAKSAASVTDAIREFFSHSRIDPARYQHRVDEMPGPDPDDHVHSAAALVARADALITWDAHGFPSDALGQLGLRVVDPDTYLIEVLHEFPAEVHATIDTMVRTRTRPTTTRTEVLAALRAAGLVEFTEEAGDGQ